MFKMTYDGTELLMLVLIISIFTIIQSLFGVGLLVFGTPTLLLLGYSFPEALTYLLPSSISVSFFQVRDRWDKISLYRLNVFYFLLPMVAIGLLVVLYSSIFNLYLLIGIMLLLTSVIRFSTSLNESFATLLANNFKIGLAIVGFIHGLTNLGGAPLVAITTGIYNKKTKVQANIAYAYLTMAAVQTIILIATGEFIFNITSLLLPFCSVVIYFLIGKQVFENTDEIIYHHLMTFFIFGYGILLIFNSF